MVKVGKARLKDKNSKEAKRYLKNILKSYINNHIYDLTIIDYPEYTEVNYKVRDKKGVINND